MKANCKKCKFGEWEWEDYIYGSYHCMLCDEWISEKDGENEELPCMGFVPDDRYSDDDTSA